MKTDLHLPGAIAALLQLQTEALLELSSVRSLKSGGTLLDVFSDTFSTASSEELINE
jgi:hypothetical protein